MSLIRLFIDEDSMDRRFVRALRARRMDITTAGEIGTTSFSDEDQLMLATEQQRVFYTFNVGDFCQLHSTYMIGPLSSFRPPLAIRSIVHLSYTP